MSQVATFLYRCPKTGFRVQGHAPDRTSDEWGAFEVVTCTVCAGVHLVNPKTGKVLGKDNE